MAAASDASAENSKGNALIIVVVLIIFGLVLGGFGYVKLKVSRESAAWPTTQGRITMARLDRTRSNNKTKYSPRLSYSYTVKGAHYTGHNVSAVTSYTSRSRAQAVLSRYPTGSAVTVHYNPDKPSSAVLEPGGSGQALLITAFGVICFILALLVGISALRR